MKYITRMVTQLSILNWASPYDFNPHNTGSYHAWIHPASCKQTDRPCPGSPAHLYRPGQGYSLTDGGVDPDPGQRPRNAPTRTGWTEYLSRLLSKSVHLYIVYTQIQVWNEETWSIFKPVRNSYMIWHQEICFTNYLPRSNIDDTYFMSLVGMNVVQHLQSSSGGLQ